MSDQPTRAAVAPGPEIKRFRVIVTGHDAQERSVILSDRLSPHVMPIRDPLTFAAPDSGKPPAPPAATGAAAPADPCSLPIQVQPPAGGSAFRVVQFPPDKDWAAKAAAMGGVVPVDETAQS